MKKQIALSTRQLFLNNLSEPLRMLFLLRFSFPPMTDNPSITNWIHQLRSGDEAAAEKIWTHYLSQLLRVARSRMGDLPRRVYDEEDAALSAFHLFTNRAQNNAFPQLDDRHDLWRLLVMITAQKVTAWRRRESAGKRGGGKVRGDSVLGASDQTDNGFLQFVSDEPTPEFVIQAAEECDRLLDRLDEKQQKIALMRMEGFTNSEVASAAGMTERSIERKLEGIRRVWEKELTEA